MKRHLGLLLCGGAMLLLGARPASAGWFEKKDPKDPPKKIYVEPWFKQKEPWTLERAGNPHHTHKYAKPTITSHYTPGWIGGSAFGKKGHAPGVGDGTWGLDYTGHYIPKKVFLGWWHRPTKHQGNYDEQYQTEHPKGQVPILPVIREF